MRTERTGYTMPAYNKNGDTMHRIILAAIILTGCANTNQTAQRWADSKYNRCVDKVHAEAKTRHLNWRLEIDACMGSKGDEYQQYQYAKDTKLPPRWSVEVTP